MAIRITFIDREILRNGLHLVGENEIKLCNIIDIRYMEEIEEWIKIFSKQKVFYDSLCQEINK